MVKIIYDDRPRSVEIDGGLLEVVAQLGYAIGTIHGNLKKYGDTNAAELFKYAMHAAMAPDSPTWEVDPEGVAIVRVTEKSGTPTDQS